MGQFVWADLSTYDPEKSIEFYQSVFDWRFENVDGYFVAHQGAAEVVGLFETPDVFKKIKMPHFWMSYIAVDDAFKTAEVANTFDEAKVELKAEFYGGNIALIRDPKGAGFTVYDGGKLNSRTSQTGSLCWNELHVSNAQKVIPFYESLFDWSIERDAIDGVHAVFDENHQHVTDITEISNEIKGKNEYWVCSFAVENLAQTKDRILACGGGMVSDEGHRILMHDDSEEAFFYIKCIS